MDQKESAKKKENPEPPQHTIENPTDAPAVKPTDKPLNSDFEPLLRQHLTQPVSDAAKRPPIVKRSDKGAVQVLP